MEYAFNPNLAVNTAAQQDIAARRREMEALSKSADPEAQRAKLRDACEGFEAIFLQKNVGTDAGHPAQRRPHAQQRGGNVAVHV